ncbi:MAG: carboxypeptidase regulatory-like domain-containing protein [Terriglobia bacterium]|nr:carboxypeptidase regulatory-like domain-containing protein [Terriglobia bacterium]
MKYSKGWTLVMCLLAVCLLAATALGQSLVTGDVAGTVTDPTHAVISNATVTVKSLDTGATYTATTNEMGFYRVGLLKPGRYEVSVEQSGFGKTVQNFNVQVGITATVNLTLSVAKESQTVEVTDVAPLVNTSPSQNTSFTALEVSELPSAGGDVTNIAFTAPGAVVNNQGGYGNFTVNGLPATSNLFTINGENNMDPYFNINNSGASNLSLGSNEVQEATVVANPYGGQYGQLSGAQVTMVTRSGTNEFHGNAQWLWNGRAMNANNWINNHDGAPRAFSNANQWAAGVGGPIKKDSTFFFVNTEGLRFVIPNNDYMVIPTPEFANAVLANVQNLQPNSAATYQQMFQFWANTPGASTAQPIANDDYCNGLNLPGFDPATQHCAEDFTSSPTAFASEWILSGRVDQRFGDKDNAFFRWKMDHGLQPTTIDPVDPRFDAISKQPSWDTQLQETHVFGPNTVNAFTASLSHYVAQFTQSQPLASDTFPYAIITYGSVPFTGFNEMYNFPQGRNITQYQFLDDFTWNRGRHSLKFGGNFRRYDVSDHSFYFNYPAAYFGYVGDGLQQFADGLAYQYRKTLNQSSNVPIAMWGLGMYASDEWKVTSNLTLTLAIRAERNSNPVCQTNCFSNFTGDFSTLASVQAGANAGDVPYSQDIRSGLHQAFPGVDFLDWSPRIGFSWSPFGNNKTVVSGGFGLFYDSPPSGLVDDLLANPPVSVSIRIRPTAGTPAFDTTPTGSAAAWDASANAFSTGYLAGESYNQINAAVTAAGGVFTAPSFTSIVGTMHAPRWQEWNLQIQREINPSTSLTVNYAGNHGIHIPYTNAWYNAYDPYELYGGLVPYEPTVPNYGTITQVMSGAVSNYNGLTVSLRRQMSKWVTAHVNYTWSHNLDEVSNGGVFTYGDSILGQMQPDGLKAGNYGNSDYDVRHNFSADYVINPSLNVANGFLKNVLNGWQWSGKVFWRSGLPFSVVDGYWNGAIYNGGSTILAQPIAGVTGQTSCGSAAGGSDGSSCLNAAAFVDSTADSFMGYTAFSSQRRNQFRGPSFFNMDMNLFKNINVGERMKFAVGAQAFNVFNHPNFGTPDYNLFDSNFGKITSMTTVPTSPYGNFLGFDSSPRVVQLTLKMTF